MKIFFSDIDGTFIYDEGIPPENIEAVRQIEAAGHRFVFVTGRGIAEVQPILDEAGIDCDYIYGNGSGYKLMGQPPVLQFTVPKTDYDFMEEILKRHDAFYYIHTDKSVVIQHLEQLHERFEGLRAKYQELFNGGNADAIDNHKAYFNRVAHFVDDPFDYLREHPERELIKFELLDHREFVREAVAKDAASRDYFSFSSKWINLEVVPPETSKANGIAHYLTLFDHVEQTYGFGDAMNDYAMFQAVDVGVAVANAKANLKAIADVILDGEVMGSYIIHNLL